MNLPINTILQGDVLERLKELPDESIDCVVTSPPYYGLRDYGVEGQIGLEKTLEEYLAKLLKVTAELKRVLKKTGTIFWNHGDSYNANWRYGDLETCSEKQKGNKGTHYFMGKNMRNENGNKNRASAPVAEKCLLLQNFRLIQRMIDEQKWILRNIIIWHKPNCMPSSVKDRFTVDFEPVFFLTKSKKYWFETQYEKSIWFETDKRAINGPTSGGKAMSGEYAINKGGAFRQDGNRNMRAVWKIPTKPYSEAHFATFPPELIETPIKAGCPEFICKKCGKAREKIFDITRQYTPVESKTEKGKLREQGIGSYKRPNSKENGGFPIPNKKEVGYTDCGCNAGWNAGIVLDPFAGSCTTAMVARKLGRNYLGIELNPQYIKLCDKRLAQEVLL